MKIIITGATGAFGFSLAQHLNHLGHEIIAAGRSETPPTELTAFAQYIRFDIRSPFTLPDADVCIHAAALSDDKAKTQDLFEVNPIGTKNTIEAARHIATFILISSSSVYLPQENPIQEDDAGKQSNLALSPYGKSKLESEEVFHQFFKGKQGFILRARAFYGAGDVKIIPRMLKLVKNNTFNRPGGMNIKLSMTHYENMGHAIDCCLNAPLTGTHIYNVADDEEYIMINVLHTLFENLYGKQLKEKKIPISLLKGLAFFRIGGFTPLLVRALTQNMVLDVSKIKNELGYKPTRSFNESLPEIVNWVDDVGGPEKLKHPKKEMIWKK